MQPVEAESIGRAMLAGGRRAEDVLESWRENGLSILHSIQCLVHITAMTLSQAKEVVHTSETWSDMRPAFDDFHARLEAVVDKQ